MQPHILEVQPRMRSGMCSHVFGMCSHVSRICSHIYDGESGNTVYLSPAGALLILENVNLVLGVAFNIAYHKSYFLCFIVIFLYFYIGQP